jgi:hypothetical protein
MRKKIILSREKNAYHEPERTTYELRIRQTVLTLSSFASFFFFTNEIRQPLFEEYI